MSETLAHHRGLGELPRRCQQAQECIGVAVITSWSWYESGIGFHADQSRHAQGGQQHVGQLVADADDRPLRG
jgi:hypothetical protein